MSIPKRKIRRLWQSFAPSYSVSSKKFEPPHDKTETNDCAPREDSGQSEHPPSSLCAQWVAKDSSLLHIKVRLPVLLCAVKTVEGDFRFCWTTSPNVGQTHKESPNLVRIFYMICILNDIYKQYNKFTRTLIHNNQFTSLGRGQKPASKCIRLVYEILVICRALQALYTPQRCELMKRKITLTVPIGY